MSDCGWRVIASTWSAMLFVLFTSSARICGRWREKNQSSTSQVGNCSSPAWEPF